MRIALVALTVALASPVVAAERSFPIPGIGMLSLAVPDGWQVVVDAEARGVPPTLRLTADRGDRASLQLTPLPVAPELRKQLLGPAGLRGGVQAMADAIAPGAVEKALAPLPLGGGREGFYFGATDKAPGPGEFAYLTQGALAAGEGVICTFTLLTDPGSKAIARGLDAIRSIRAAPAR